MSLESRHLCNGLIRRSIELRALYRRAAALVSEPGLRTVLDEEAQSLDHVIAELQAQVQQQEQAPATRSRILDATRQRLDTWLVRGTPRGDDAWIRLLARHEQGLLRAFERALTHASTSDLTLALNRQLPRLHSIHLDMHSLAKAVGQ